MDLNALILADGRPGLFEFILHLAPNFDRICSQPLQLLLCLILELPQPVASLNESCALHQEFELPEVAVGPEEPPLLLDGHRGHCWATVTFIHFLWIPDYPKNLCLVGYATN